MEDFVLDSHEHFVNSRTKKNEKVNVSLHKINKMYTNLSEIVSKQGETLNHLENNVGQTKNNTGGAVTEMRRTLSTEKSLRDKVGTCDTGIMCLAIWFIVAVVFFGLDLGLSQNTINL